MYNSIIKFDLYLPWEGKNTILKLKFTKIILCLNSYLFFMPDQLLTNNYLASNSTDARQLGSMLRALK